jgi:glucose/arabinose dehydrogenase
MVRSLTGLVTAVVVTMFAVVAPAAALSPGGTFVDDDLSVHEGSIEAIAALGITKGCNPPFGDEFCGSASITRGQMAAFLRRALEGSIPEGSADPFTDVAGSIFVDDIAWLARTGITKGCNPPANDRFCPRDDVTREEMATFLTRALGLAPIVPEPRGELRLEPIGPSFTQPVHVTAPVGDPRLFVVEKGGRIWAVTGSTKGSVPFLDISGLVVNSGEKGMFSMAFHPDFADNGRFFVMYSGALRAGAPSGSDHTAYIVEYRVTGDPAVADASTRRVVLTVDEPRENHNGGHILFGPDGMLYVTFGDGGGGGDPFENGQDITTLLGSILRIDVDGGDPYGVPATNPYVATTGADEIWISGVRNPWRIWFDEGDLYVADVGQSAWEEITVVDGSTGGLDLGWNTVEGPACYDPASGCDRSGLVPPSLSYGHSDGCSITGGVVYRGSITELEGWYLYADVCSSWIRAARFVDGELVDQRDLTKELSPSTGAWSFGVDASGEMYIVYGNAGRVYRFVSD